MVHDRYTQVRVFHVIVKGLNLAAHWLWEFPQRCCLLHECGAIDVEYLLRLLLRFCFLIIYLEPVIHSNRQLTLNSVLARANQLDFKRTLRRCSATSLGWQGYGRLVFASSLLSLETVLDSQEVPFLMTNRPEPVEYLLVNDCFEVVLE